VTLEEDFKTWRERMGWSQKDASMALGLSIEKIAEFEANNISSSEAIDKAHRHPRHTTQTS